MDQVGIDLFVGTLADANDNQCLNNLRAESPESGATESVTGGSTEEPSSVSSRTDQSQGTILTDGDNIGLLHLLAVALFSFIGGTMLGVKIK